MEFLEANARLLGAIKAQSAVQVRRSLESEYLRPIDLYFAMRTTALIARGAPAEEGAADLAEITDALLGDPRVEPSALGGPRGCAALLIENALRLEELYFRPRWTLRARRPDPAWYIRRVLAHPRCPPGTGHLVLVTATARTGPAWLLADLLRALAPGPGADPPALDPLLDAMHSRKSISLILSQPLPSPGELLQAAFVGNLEAGRTRGVLQLLQDPRLDPGPPWASALDTEEPIAYQPAVVRAMLGDPRVSGSAVSGGVLARAVRLGHVEAAWLFLEDPRLFASEEDCNEAYHDALAIPDTKLAAAIRRSRQWTPLRAAWVGAWARAARGPLAETAPGSDASRRGGLLQRGDSTEAAPLWPAVGMPT